MISSDLQLEQTRRQLNLMQDALRSLKRDVFPKSKRNFALLAEGPLEQIRRLQAEIDDYMGVTYAVESEAQLWVRVYGSQVHWPSTSTSLLSHYLEALRKGVQTVAEFLQQGLTGGGRPSQELRDACDFEVISFQSGSVCLGLRLPDNDLSASSNGMASNPAEQALNELLAMAAWAGSEDSESFLAEKFSDVAKRRVLLNALKPLLPRPRGQVEGIEFSGWRVSNATPIKLNRDTLNRVNGAIDHTIQDQSEEHQGDLREIDLDELTFTLRQSDKLSNIRCKFDASILEQAKSALDKRVQVSGTRRISPNKASHLQITRLEVMEEEKEALGS